MKWSAEWSNCLSAAIWICQFQWYFEPASNDPCLGGLAYGLCLEELVWTRLWGSFQVIGHWRNKASGRPTVKARWIASQRLRWPFSDLRGRKFSSPKNRPVSKMPFRWSDLVVKFWVAWICLGWVMQQTEVCLKLLGFKEPVEIAKFWAFRRIHILADTFRYMH